MTFPLPRLSSWSSSGNGFSSGFRSGPTWGPSPPRGISDTDISDTSGTRSWSRRSSHLEEINFNLIPPVLIESQSGFDSRDRHYSKLLYTFQILGGGYQNWTRKENCTVFYFQVERKEYLILFLVMPSMRKHGYRTITMPVIPSQALLQVHVSQADGRILWWMYTLWERAK